MLNRKYPRCHIIGQGEFTDKLVAGTKKFEIVDISAAGVRIRTNAQLPEDSEIDMKIRFSGYIFEVILNAAGKVVRKREMDDGLEYAVEFTNLHQKDRTEIDELIKYSCSERHEGPTACDEGNCLFFESAKR